jgi:hypothetical protein
MNKTLTTLTNTKSRAQKVTRLGSLTTRLERKARVSGSNSRGMARWIT